MATKRRRINLKDQITKKKNAKTELPTYNVEAKGAQRETGIPVGKFLFQTGLSPCMLLLYMSVG